MNKPTTPIEWRIGPAGDSIGFVGANAVFQILPTPFYSPQKWNIFDQHAKLIGSAGSLHEAKAWCEKSPLGHQQRNQRIAFRLIDILHASP
jgi:hypothetical protein